MSDPEKDSANAVPRAAQVLVFCIVLAYCVYFYQGAGPNQFSRFALTAALAEHGTVKIDDYHQLTFDKARKDGHFFSDKPPGLSLLGVPVFFVLHHLLKPLLGMAEADWRNLLLYLLTVSTVSLPVALAMVSFFRRAWQEAGPRAAFWVTMGLGLGSPLTVYASLYYSHALCGALLWLSFALVTKPIVEPEEPSSRRYALAGLLAGWANLSEMPTGLITLLLLVHLVVHNRFAWRPVLAFVLGGLPTLGILLCYNWSAFGNPFASGYQYCYIQEFRDAMAVGIMGVTTPSWQAAQGILVGKQRGLLFYWPFFFFCVVPSIISLFLRKRVRGPVLLALAICGVYFLFGCSYFLWTGGAAFGPRHLVPCFPFAAYLAVQAYPFLPRFLAPFFSLISVGIVLMAVSTLAEYGEGFTFPLLQVTVPLFLNGKVSVKVIGPEGRFMPPGLNLSAGDPGFYDAVNLGEMCGLSGLLSLVPLAVVGMAMIGMLWRIVRAKPPEGDIRGPS